MLLQPGTRVGPYEILAPVGSGGMGVVYRAHDARLARDVAIKVVSGEIAMQPDARLRFEPGFLLAHQVLVYANEGLGRYEEAIAWVEPLATASGFPLDSAARLLAAHRSGGAAGYGHERLRLLEESAARRYVPPHAFLYACAMLQQFDQALVWAERCVAVNAGMLVFLGIDPCVDDLRADPRFIALLERLGLPAIRRSPYPRAPVVATA